MSVKEVAGREENGKRELEWGAKERGSVSVGEAVSVSGYGIGKEWERWISKSRAVIMTTVNKHRGWIEGRRMVPRETREL
jgi:hypothetical protein